MKTEIITEGTLPKYMGLLTNEDFFGIIGGRYTGFGVTDEATDEVLGILSAQVLPKYIHIKNCFVSPDHRGKGVGKSLIKAVTDVPKDIDLPFIFYGTDEEINREFLEAEGFKKTPDTYSYIESKLVNMKALTLPHIASDISVFPAEQVSGRLIGDFVFSSKKDTFLQFPEGVYDANRFSDGSIVCMKNKQIVALILIEEKDDHILIPYMYGDDLEAVFLGLSVFKKKFLEDYANGEKIRFLICRDNEKEVAAEILSNYSEKKIYIYEKK